MSQNLNQFFESYLKTEPLIVNKKVLQFSYMPKIISHRKEQIDNIASILAPALRMEKPSNLFIYGKSGTGKSLSVAYTYNEIAKIALKNNLPLKILYLNCKLKKVADTEYRVIAQLTRELGRDVPATGLPTDEVYKNFISEIDNEKILLIIILDEIDQLVSKIGDEILYNFTRLNNELKKSEISLIGISNSLVFTNHLDPRVRSSLSEEEISFPPYDALQLQSILQQRAKLAFRPSVLEEGVIEKCAAYAAHEHGDARRALELLRVAGELAERGNDTKITIRHLDRAQDKIERDRVIDNVNVQPKQFKLVLYAIFDLCNTSSKAILTGDAYEIYKKVAQKAAVMPLTQRRVSDIIAELDFMGIINAKTVSYGRYGRTKEIRLGIPQSALPNITKLLKDNLNL